MVYFVGAGPGAPDLITVRGMRLIEKADVLIYAGSLVNPELLDYAKESCEIYNSARMTLEEVVKVMEQAEQEQKVTVRLHTGEPSIYGAVQEQMEQLLQRQIPYESCPGVSACFGAAASLNLEYTLPGISQTLIITRMEGRTPVPETEQIESLAAHRSSMAIYLSAGMLEELCDRLIQGGYAKETPAALVYKATWPQEESYVTTLEELPAVAREHKITRTALVLVGEAVDHKQYDRSCLYDPDFETGYRKRTGEQKKIIYVVGMGPGAESMMTGEALEVLRDSDTIVGYSVYLDLLGEEFAHKERLSTPMRQEAQRCRMCFEEAEKGKKVALICSGDAGIYGMASLMYEIGEEYPDCELEIIPGITAASSGAAVLGAPLNHDFCVISLSDLLTPWETIEKRLRAAARGDFCIAIYNPSSKKRADYLTRACDILLEEVEESRACGYVENIGRQGTTAVTCTLKELRTVKVNMFTTVFIGNSQTRILDGKLVTKRGYRL